MARKLKMRFIEPQGDPARPLNAYIRRYPLLGPIILATLLDERGYDAAVYDENVSGPLDQNPEAWRDVISSDVVGLSVMTPTACRGYAIADRIRREAPGVRIAFGGAHATFVPDEVLPHGDIVCRGEGETVIEKILLGEIRSGIIQPEPVADLDTLPTPNHYLMRDFDKLVASSYKRELFQLPMMTSRGCPHGCIYCAVTQMFGRKVRRQSVERVMRDLAHYAGQGFKLMFFYDDNFITDRDWAKALLERMRPMRLRFNAQARVDFPWTDGTRTKRDHDLLRAMRRGGCSGLLLGYETIDDQTAKDWNKGYRGGKSLESRMYEDTQVLHEYGIWTYGMFVMGPQHTERTAERILRFARRSQLHSLQLSILTPFPGTPLFEQMRPHLFLTRFPEDWNWYDGVHCVFNNGRLGVEGLHRVVLDIHKRYYRIGGWNPRSIRTIARRPISFSDKVIDIATSVSFARGLFGRWSREINRYVEMVKARTAEAEPVNRGRKQGQ